MMGDYTLYKHTSPSGKVYIGITRKKPKERWKNGLGYRTQPYFYKAIVKYGWDNFEHEIIFSGLTENVAKCKEMSLISLYQANDKEYGYNSTLGGDGGLGYSPPEEVRIKISVANKGKRRSDETRKRISMGKMGVRPTEETRRKLAKRRPSVCGEKNPMYGKHHSDEVRRKMSERRPKKTVVQIGNDGTILNSYISAREAERQTGIDHSTIIRCCKNKQNTAGGFRWKYGGNNSV